MLYTCGRNRQSISILMIAFVIIPILISACQPVNAATSLPTMPPTVTQQPSATAAPAILKGEISLNSSGLAQNAQVETIAAVTPGADKFWTIVMPEHRRTTLQGYPVNGIDMKPQLMIYPAADLATFSEPAGKTLTDLKALLQTRQPGESLPFLPLVNGKQAVHAQVRYLDFKNGNGVRYLAQYNTGMMKVNNVQLVYTFQGLTSDGKFYIAAVLPVTHPELPAAAEGFATSETELKGYPDYLAKTAAWLDQQPAARFTPDLAKLDAMIQSIEVK
jgi:hypothetical protein